MAYTHYWQRPVRLLPEAFARAVADCQRLLPDLGVPLAGAWGTGAAQFGPTLVMFNGATGFCEAFRIEQVSTGRRHGSTVLEFCKTARLPYDLAVQVALIVFKHYLGRCFVVASDGQTTAWDNARRICQERLGYGADFQLERG